MASWLGAHVPVAVLLALPNLLGLTVLLRENPDGTVLAVAILAMAATVLMMIALLLRTGWLRFGELASTTVGDLRDRRLAAEHRSSFLQALVEDLTFTYAETSETATRLLAELVRAEENTHSHLAAELHDTVAQSLSAALIGLQGVNEAQHVEAREAVRDAEEQLRTVLARIRPPVLASQTLAEVVADICIDIEHRYGTQVDVHWSPGSVVLPAAMATVVYRFAQEGLLNAVEHADGVEVGLAVWTAQERQGPVLCVQVSDKGVGFDPDAVRSVGGRHVGLALAKERARLAGGSLDIDSSPGGGTVLRLRLPLPPDSLVPDAPDAVVEAMPGGSESVDEPPRLIALDGAVNPD